MHSLDLQNTHVLARCPYCHEGIDLEADAWVACVDCLARHHDDCWEELDGSCATCRGQERLHLAHSELKGARPAGTREAERATKPRPPHSPRRFLWLVLTLAGFALAYRLLVAGGAEQTSALFVGLPALLSLGLALTPPARTVTGMTVKATTLALLLSGMLLGEGLICVLMAAPLFYLVAISVGLGVDAARARGVSRSKAAALACLLVAPLALEGLLPATSFSRDEQVVVRRTLAASPWVVQAGLRAPMRYPDELPAFMDLGFPRPQQAGGRGLEPGDRRWVRMAGSEGAGILILEVVSHQAPDAREGGRLELALVRDTTPIAHWLTWERMVVCYGPEAGGGTWIEWSASYRRDLDPSWYFGPLQRYAVGAAVEVMIEALPLNAARDAGDA